jgi:tRNA threonylcarbamoyl adenosine modification protein YjeE
LTIERLRAPNLPAFERAASAFARSLRPGDVVALAGNLGAGKTTFVAAAVAALHGPAAEVSSPTFTFWHRYPGTPPVEHLDLYRIEDPAEATELGLHEALRPESVAFVEWPERLPGLLPVTAVRIRIDATDGDPGARELTIERP